MHIWNELTYINKSSLALGFFDGVHVGHNVVLKNAVNIAKVNNTKSTVVTFKTHPMTLLSDKNVEQLLTLDEKLILLEKTGIDNVVLLDFENIASMKAGDYLENILVKYFSPIAITTGFNHNFGYKKEGDSKFFAVNQEKYRYKYFEVPPFVVSNNVVSCSVIRNMIHLGNFQDANNLLGYKFFITGQVIEGDKIAGKFGFPSANILYPEEKIKVPFGVYFVKVEVDGKKYNGVLNYGFAPTIDNVEKLKTEVHIIDFDNDIYGKNIKIYFIAKIRNQMKFENVEKLKSQIVRDIAFTDIYKYFLTGQFELSRKRYM